MANPIVTPELSLSAEIQLALVNGMDGLRNLLANPATDMGVVLGIAELLLERYQTSIKPFVLSTSQNLVGKAGVILGMGQLASAIGDMKAGKSFDEVYADLSTSLSGMAGSTALMMEAYAGQLIAEGGAAAMATGNNILRFAKPINTAGMAFTVGTIIGDKAYPYLPTELKDAIGGTLYEINSRMVASINELNDPTLASSSPKTISGIASPIVPDGLSAYKSDTLFWELNGPNYTGRIYSNEVTYLKYADREVWKMPDQAGKGGWTETPRFDARTGVTLRTDFLEYSQSGNLKSTLASFANGSYTKVVYLSGGQSVTSEHNVAERYDRVTRVLSNGQVSQVLYTRNPNNAGAAPTISMSQYSSPDGSYSRLVDNRDGTFTAVVYDGLTQEVTRSTSGARVESANDNVWKIAA